VQPLSSQSLKRATLLLLSPDAKDAKVSAKNSCLVFQYIPEKLIHTFNRPLPEPTSVLTSKNSLVELFHLSFEFDSTDPDLQTQTNALNDFGIHPALAMLESLVQPQMPDNLQSIPFVVFNWGTHRSVIVQIMSMSIEETVFDGALNPLRATINLILRVLNGSEITANKGAQDVYFNHQNMHAVLVEAYKLNTGQPCSGGKVTGVSSPSATQTNKTKRVSKTKINV
jgi:hypothetical protein